MALESDKLPVTYGEPSKKNHLDKYRLYGLDVSPKAATNLSASDALVTLGNLWIPDDIGKSNLITFYGDIQAVNKGTMKGRFKNWFKDVFNVQLWFDKREIQLWFLKPFGLLEVSIEQNINIDFLGLNMLKPEELWGSMGYKTEGKHNNMAYFRDSDAEILAIYGQKDNGDVVISKLTYRPDSSRYFTTL